LELFVSWNRLQIIIVIIIIIIMIIIIIIIIIIIPMFKQVPRDYVQEEISQSVLPFYVNRVHTSTFPSVGAISSIVTGNTALISSEKDKNEALGWKMIVTVLRSNFFIQLLIEAF